MAVNETDLKKRIGAWTKWAAEERVTHAVTLTIDHWISVCDAKARLIEFHHRMDKKTLGRKLRHCPSTGRTFSFAFLEHPDQKNPHWHLATRPVWGKEAQFEYEVGRLWSKLGSSWKVAKIWDLPGWMDYIVKDDERNSDRDCALVIPNPMMIRKGA